MLCLKWEIVLGYERWLKVNFEHSKKIESSALVIE